MEDHCSRRWAPICGYGTQAPESAPDYGFGFAGFRNGRVPTDPVNNTTEWAYDYEGRVLTETNALNAVRSFVYDAHGRLIERTDRLGRIREFDYDDLGQLIEERWLESDGLTLVNTLTWSYDAGSQLIVAGDDDSGYTLDYDDLGRLIEIDNTLTPDMPDVVQNYQYDDLGRRTSASATVNNVADFTNTYAYDAAGRMTRVEQTGSVGGNDVAEKRVDLTYDVLGRFATIKRYEDLAAIELVATTDYTFDSAGRLTDLDHTGLGSNDRNYDYTYDSSGRITSMTTPDGSATYSYDDTDQLIGADYTFQADEDYAYDANGNRTGALYETGTNNRLEADGRYTYEYDAEGNLVRKQTRQILVTGADSGAGPHVLVYDGKTGEELGSFFAYDPGFTAGVRVAVGDVNGDGVADIVTSPGTGGGPHIKVFDGTKVLGGTDPTGSTPLASFFADDPGVTNGVFVALGDIDGDGKVEIITGLDGGGAPIVKIFDGGTGDLIAELNAYPGFGGGVRVAAGDIDGDGKADIITGAGPGATPHIKVFDGANLSGPLLADFQAYTGVSQGVYVAAGDVNGDGKADIVTSPGAGIAPHVKVFSGADSGVGTPGTELASFFAYDSANTQGVRVATTDITDPLLNDPDGRADIVTVQGAGSTSEVRIFDGDVSTGSLVDSFTVYGGFVGGSFLGGTGQNAPEDVQYHFDHKNQLTRVEFYGVNNNVTKAVEFDYDVFGRLIQKHVLKDNSGTLVLDRGEKYVYDSAGKTDPATGVALDDVVLVYDNTNQLKSRLLHGPAIDQIFASEDAVGEILWGLADHQGTVRDVVNYDAGNNTATVTNHRKFDAFGNLTSESNAAVDFLASYTGRIFDEDVGLYYYRRRWYNALTHQFLSEDSIKDGLNWYAYVGNSPINRMDPSGLADDYLIPAERQQMYILGGAGRACAACHPVQDYQRSPELKPVRPRNSGNSFQNTGTNEGASGAGDFHGLQSNGSVQDYSRNMDPRVLQRLQQGGDYNPIVRHPANFDVDRALLNPTPNEGFSIESLHTLLDGSGLVDPTPFSDGLNSVLYAFQGRWCDAGISVVAIFPYVGDFGKASRYADDTAEFLAKEIDDLAEEAKRLGLKNEFDEAFPELGKNCPTNVSASSARLPPRGTPERAAIEAARRRGITGAQTRELANIRAGGRGSGVWNERELQQIRQTGQFPSDVRWHHDPTVANRPDLAGDPAVVRPVRGGTAGHLEAHGGSFLLPRE